MSEDGVVLIEGDPELAAKCYPSGTKNEATAMCLCGSVEISLKTDEPSVSGFCHCWACRRAHSAPLYQVIYTDNANIDPATGSLREGEFEIMVTKGFKLLRPGDPGPGNPNWESQDDNPNFGDNICNGRNIFDNLQRWSGLWSFFASRARSLLQTQRPPWKKLSRFDQILI